ncbi:MAG: glycosyltransferase [Prevotella sp.]|nr:glycosyltransferase [Prevotella sp.]
MSPKISIIVPIYRAEKTLRRCVDSLLQQDLEDFEVVLVDDGSPDRCGEICDDYAQKDRRVKVIHQENGGVAAARQAGIDAAQGEYTIHADPDDWVDPGMLSALYRKAEEENTDMVICDYWLNTYQGQKRVTQRPSSLEHFEVIRDLFGSLMGSTWNKLVRRECYERYGIRFPEGISYCEDLYVCVALLSNPLRVAYLPEAFYHYERPLNTSSLSRNYTDKSYRQDLRLNTLFHDLLKDTPVGPFVDEKRRYDTMSNAFFNGYGYFSAGSFRRTFSSVLPLVWRGNHSLPERILLTLACLGAYPVARGFVEMAMKMKHLIARKKRD